jgi:drug/metabolite transporter (DMT)-like permease
VWVVLALSLAASFLMAASNFLQQRAARSVAQMDPRAARASGAVLLMRKLLRSSTWLAGWLVNTAGFFAQAVALHLGSVAVVQPVMSTQLLFAVPLGAWQLRIRPRRMDAVFALLVSGGLVVFFGVAGVAPNAAVGERDRVLPTVFATLGLVVLMQVVGTKTKQAITAHLAAVGAGFCFALTAVLTKLTMTDLVHRGVAATATDWPGYLLAIATASGMVLEQTAFAGGPLPWAIAAMSVTNPLAGYTMGILSFDVAFPTSVGALAGVAGSGALLVAGLAGLANSPVAQAFYGHAETAAQETIG